MAHVDSVRPHGESPAAGNWTIAWNKDSEEWLNGLTHAAGCLLSLWGTVLLFRHLGQHDASWHSLSCVVYCISLISVYAASTLSHWVRLPTWRRRFRMWDQGLIFLLIAASYTPLAIGYLRSGWYVLTVLMWVLGIAGFISKVAYGHRVNRIALWLYLGLGWLPILGLPALFHEAPIVVFALVVGGGLAYTLGSALLANDHRAPYLHAGWHLFVIIGSTCHYVAVYNYFVTAV